jgi:Protein of unknown function (DUF1595)/Protein of unknown function (DUF1592)
VQITGPFAATGPGDTPSRRKIFVCRPPNERAAAARTGGDDESACAKQILSTLARRAYRRPPTDGEIDGLLAFYKTGRRRGTFDAGIEESVTLLLASPAFLFRAEPDPPQLAAGTIYPVADFELASRLSFFLWSTIPDDELLNVAAQGKLRDPGTLEKQVRRMLADPR